MKETKRKLMLNGLGMPRALWMAALWIVPLTVAGQITHTWVGNGEDALASTAANWSGGIAPDTGDHIRFDDSHFGNLWTNATWDLDIEAASWTQTVAYAGTVTFETRYPDSWREAWGYASLGATFTNLFITGNCLLEAGTWTHPPNPDVEDDRHRIAVSVGGNFLLDSNAVIQLNGIGFQATRGPGGGTDSSGAKTTRGASLGGHGGHGVDAPDAPSPTYGCFMTPYRLGGGGGKHSGGSRGGGAVDINVNGALTLNGDILANGISGHGWRPAGAGGSVFLRGATLTGSGRIEARGWSARTGGGGGRIAVHLSAANDFDAVTFDASGGNGTGGEDNRAAAGTIYLQGVENNMVTAELRIDNQGLETAPGWVFTPIPSDIDASGSASIFENARSTTLIIDRNARVSLNTDVRMLDLFLRAENDAWLYLQGHTLFLRSPYHDDWGHEDWVVYEGGEIVWTPRGTIFLLR